MENTIFNYQDHKEPGKITKKKVILPKRPFEWASPFKVDDLGTKLTVFG